MQNVILSPQRPSPAENIWVSYSVYECQSARAESAIILWIILCVHRQAPVDSALLKMKHFVSNIPSLTALVYSINE